jgi:hypothetical protein
VVGALALVSSGSASAAPATVTPEVVVHDPQVFEATAFCLPETLVGTVTTQEVTYGTSVETSSGVFVVHGVDEFSYRIDFPDGNFVESGINRDRFVFVRNPAGGIFTRVTQDFETIYNSTGEAVGDLAVHAVLHTTWRDSDRDGFLDDGELTTQVETFRLRCP